ncbi:DUF736 family protein [Bradyrhizobium sp. 195]|nr:DUF736 family protein [Bradyrhizobium sp. 195]
MVGDIISERVGDFKSEWWARSSRNPGRHRSESAGRDYLSLKLDDPSFTAPIFANLFDDEDGEGFSLIWSRLVRAGHRRTQESRRRTLWP